MPVTLVDPATSPVPYRHSIACRQPITSAPVIGIVVNGKTNAEAVLCGVADRLEKRFGITVEREIVVKPHASRVMPTELIDLIARRCHFALVGVGD
ncbi:MAG: hypothetical protein VYA69_00115 [Gemmatimonadota bacterium]|nr:hypothetical protein [Gemmatimonadota bacterium]